MSIKERQLESMRVWLDKYDVHTITLCNELYALDTWTYRDDNNNVQAAHEWCWIHNATAAREFVGY